MKSRLFTYFIFLSCLTFGQSNCDSASIHQIVSVQLKVSDRWFNQPYVIKWLSTPFDSTSAYFQHDSAFTKHCHNYKADWRKFLLKSKYGRFENEEESDNDNSLKISPPIFNDDLDKCKLFVSARFSEWGGQGRIYYYVKRGQKWKVKRWELAWVS